MCGIVGIWQIDKQPISSQLLIRMRDMMRFRGPDDAGIWLDRTIGFGHRRLSVIDLSSLGHQPMKDEETGSVIVYNGEVYNFQELRSELIRYGITFKSNSDTEVILKSYKKWGFSCVDKFIGMFAFAIWDSKRKGIFLARDRIGIKPLYYYYNERVFLFASRLGPLMSHPLCPQDIDNEALGLYLEMGFVPAPRSILGNVKKLKPGHTLWIDEKGITEFCYWNIDRISIDDSLNKISENELIDKLDNLLRSAVKSRLISDVPLGAFLSGGIDSSLIAAVMCRYSSAPPKTFTIGFEEEPYDESKYAQKIAKYLGTNHETKIMSSDDLLSLLEDNTLHYDEPLADSSSLPTMMLSQFARKKIKVCLSGDGGDELFAGYHCYSIPLYLQNFYKFPHLLRLFVGEVMDKIFAPKYKIIGQSLTQKDMFSAFTFIRSITREHSRQSFFDANVLGIDDLFKERAATFPKTDEISKFCRLDMAYYLSDDILQKVDVASMSVGLEVRVPILDHRIVEFVQSLPIKYKLRVFSNKWLIKKVLSRYIPLKFFKRPKRGFVAPIDKWLREELKEVIQDELAPSRIKQFGYLNPEGVQRLIDLHLSNKCDTHQILWALLVLIRWNGRYKKS